MWRVWWIDHCKSAWGRGQLGRGAVYKESESDQHLPWTSEYCYLCLTRLLPSLNLNSIYCRDTGEFMYTMCQLEISQCLRRSMSMTSPTDISQSIFSLWADAVIELWRSAHEKLIASLPLLLLGRKMSVRRDGRFVLVDVVVVRHRQWGKVENINLCWRRVSSSTFPDRTFGWRAASSLIIRAFLALSFSTRLPLN